MAAANISFMRKLWKLLPIIWIATLCQAEAAPVSSWILVSVADQELMLVQQGAATKRYKISTSRFGVGDAYNSYRTPLGTMEVAQKIGAGAALGAVFKGRQRTGEVLAPNAAGRDPIVTRILWLRGLQETNRNAYQRAIYIHGTPVEKMIGRPASYGCIRMRSRDVADLFDRVPVGTKLKVTDTSLKRAYKALTADIRASREAS